MHAPPPRTAEVHLTRDLAAYAAQATIDALPEAARREAGRAFLNWIGCAFGGCREDAVAIAAAVSQDIGGAARCTVIGRAERTDAQSAAFLNCLSSSVLAFDDTHLETVTHPTGPVAAALTAFAERTPVRGEDFLVALALGVEIQCRLARALLAPPARANLGFYMTGLTGPIGAACALGRVAGLDETGMRAAIGLAAAQASGFRATHGTMASGFVPAQAARSAVHAVSLAAGGFTCTQSALEAPNGFLHVFGENADPRHALDGLGREHELLALAYKPYPCGIVIHPAIDVCLALARRARGGGPIVKARLRVHPLALSLTGRRTPGSPLETQVSLFHWAAAALLRGEATLDEIGESRIRSPEVRALRELVEATADAALARDEAAGMIELADGRVFETHVRHARGGAARPMTEDELDAKFFRQVRSHLSGGAAERLRDACRNLASLRDVGAELSACWDG